jgi:hypothetical protein
VDESRLNPTDQPTALKARVEQLNATILARQKTGMDVADLVQQRDDLAKRADSILTGAIVPLDKNGRPFEDFQNLTNQRNQNAAVSKSVAESAATFNKEADSFFKSYPQSNQLLRSMAEVYKAIDTNRATPQIAEAVGYLRSLPGVGELVPASLATLQGGYDQGTKDAVTKAFSTLASNELQRAPATALREALLTVADPKMSPEARYSILTRQMGEIAMEKKRFEDWVQADRPDPTKFSIQWNNNPDHQLSRFITQAKGETPTFAGQVAPPAPVYTEAQREAMRQELERRRAKAAP